MQDTAMDNTNQGRKASVDSTKEWTGTTSCSIPEEKIILLNMTGVLRDAVRSDRPTNATAEYGLSPCIANCDSLHIARTSARACWARVYTHVFPKRTPCSSNTQDSLSLHHLGRWGEPLYLMSSTLLKPFYLTSYTRALKQPGYRRDDCSGIPRLKYSHVRLCYKLGPQDWNRVSLSQVWLG